MLMTMNNLFYSFELYTKYDTDVWFYAWPNSKNFSENPIFVHALVLILKNSWAEDAPLYLMGHFIFQSLTAYEVKARFGIKFSYFCGFLSIQLKLFPNCVINLNNVDRKTSTTQNTAKIIVKLWLSLIHCNTWFKIEESCKNIKFVLTKNGSFLKLFENKKNTIPNIVQFFFSFWEQY